MDTEDKERSLAEIDSSTSEVLAIHNGDIDLLDAKVMRALEVVGKSLSTCTLIKGHYKDKPSNIVYAYIRAKQLGMDIFSFMDGTYVVGTKIGFDGQMYITLLNTCGLFEHSIRYEFTGSEDDMDNFSCTAWVTWKGSSAKAEGYCSITMAKKEGWFKNNPKWQNIPRIMLQYRAAAFLVRLNCPQIVKGYKLADELIDASSEVRIDGAAEGKKLFGETPKSEASTSSAEVIEDAKIDQETPPVQEEPVPDPEPEVIDVKPEQVSDVKDTVSVGSPGVPREVKVATIKFLHAEDKAFHPFLVAKGMLGSDELFEDINDVSLEQIWTRHDAFVKAIATEKAKGK